MNNCDHEIELKKLNPLGVLAEWYECKKCHTQFKVEEIPVYRQPVAEDLEGV